jgi:hypothetical protein
MTYWARGSRSTLNRTGHRLEFVRKATTSAQVVDLVECSSVLEVHDSQVLRVDVCVFAQHAQSARRSAMTTEQTIVGRITSNEEGDDPCRRRQVNRVSEFEAFVLQGTFTDTAIKAEPTPGPRQDEFPLDQNLIDFPESP